MSTVKRSSQLSHVDVLRGLLTPPLPDLPQRIDLHRLPLGVGKATGRQRLRMQQPKTDNAVLRASLAVALEGHGQDHAHVVGELGGVIDEGEGEPRTVAERRIAYDRYASRRVRPPRQKVPANVILPERDQIDPDASLARQQVKERSGTGTRFDESIVVDGGAVLLHEAQQRPVAVSSDLRPGKEPVESYRVDVHPSRNVRIRPPAGVSDLDRELFLGGHGCVLATETRPQPLSPSSTRRPSGTPSRASRRSSSPSSDP